MRFTIPCIACSTILPPTKFGMELKNVNVLYLKMRGCPQSFYILFVTWVGSIHSLEPPMIACITFAADRLEMAVWRLVLNTSHYKKRSCKKIMRNDMISRCPFLLCQGNNRIIIFRLQVFSQVIFFAWTACCKLCVVFQDKTSKCKKETPSWLTEWRKHPNRLLYSEDNCKKLQKRQLSHFNLITTQEGRGCSIRKHGVGSMYTSSVYKKYYLLLLYMLSNSMEVTMMVITLKGNPKDDAWSVYTACKRGDARRVIDLKQKNESWTTDGTTQFFFLPSSSCLVCEFIASKKWSHLCKKNEPSSHGRWMVGTWE